MSQVQRPMKGRMLLNQQEQVPLETTIGDFNSIEQTVDVEATEEAHFMERPWEHVQHITPRTEAADLLSIHEKLQHACAHFLKTTKAFLIS